VQHILALSGCAVVLRHWFEIDLDDASMEHGARVGRSGRTKTLSSTHSPTRADGGQRSSRWNPRCPIRMDAALLADRANGPQRLRRKRQGRFRVTSPPSEAIGRPWMARAAAPAGLWYKIARTRSCEVRLGRRVHPDRTGPGDEPAQDRIALGQDASGRLVAAGRAGRYCRTGHVELS